jgi:hypothetical protein
MVVFLEVGWTRPEMKEPLCRTVLPKMEPRATSTPIGSHVWKHLHHPYMVEFFQAQNAHGWHKLRDTSGHKDFGGAAKRRACGQGEKRASRPAVSLATKGECTSSEISGRRSRAAPGAAVAQRPHLLALPPARIMPSFQPPYGHTIVHFGCTGLDFRTAPGTERSFYYLR